LYLLYYYLLKHLIGGKIEGTILVRGRRGRRRKQLIDAVKDKTEYWKLEKKALDCTLWRICFEMGYGQITE
jgi:hypothetical protein